MCDTTPFRCRYTTESVGAATVLDTDPTEQPDTAPCSWQSGRSRWRRSSGQAWHPDWAVRMFR
jgi:hypothetical protein